MKKVKSVFRNILCIMISFVFLFQSISIIANARMIIDEKEQIEYLNMFNESVNAIKEKKPSFTYKKTSGLSQTGDAEFYYDTTSKTSSQLSDDGKKYLSVIIDAFFDPNKGIVNNLFAAITDNNTPETVKTIPKGYDTRNLLPLYGEDKISKLDSTDKLKSIMEETNSLTNESAVRLTFDEYDLESVKNSPLNKVYDLPSGTLNPMIIGSDHFIDSQGPLNDIKFEEFTFKNAYVQAEYNGNKEITKYTQTINYEFTLSWYDLIRIMGAYIKIDLMDIALSIANSIFRNTGSPEVTAKDIFIDQLMRVSYEITLELTDFDWNPRLFGDIDNNGTVNAYDARTALRHSVKLTEIKNQEDLMYADVDFNGSVTAADARIILRMSVGLEKLFSEVPEGCTIKIIDLNIPLEEDKENNNSDILVTPDDAIPDNDNSEGNNNKTPQSSEIVEGVGEFVDSIFDIINTIKSTHN